MDFTPYGKDHYTADEVAEITLRAVLVAGYSHDTENAERGICDNYSRIELALDAMTALQRYREIPKEIRDRLSNELFDDMYVMDLEERIERWLGTPDSLEPTSD